MKKDQFVLCAVITFRQKKYTFFIGPPIDDMHVIGGGGGITLNSKRKLNYVRFSYRILCAHCEYKMTEFQLFYRFDISGEMLTIDWNSTEMKKKTVTAIKILKFIIS